MSGRDGMGNSKLFSLPPEILGLPEAIAQVPPLPSSFLTVFSAFLVPLASRCLAESGSVHPGRAGSMSHLRTACHSLAVCCYSFLNLPHTTLNVVVR